jgi:hypothetical protein
MRRTRAVAVSILLLGMIVSSLAWARGGGGSHGGGSHGGGAHSGGAHGGGFHGGHGFQGSGGFHSGHFRRGASVGVIIGAPLLLPYYYPSYPPVGLAPNGPPVYIEQQGSNVPPNAQAAYWYYCSDPEGYYPSVGQCNVPWEQVTPQPPPYP